MRPLRPTLHSLSLASVLTHSDNKRVSGLGFQPSPKSPSATSDTRRTLAEIPHAALTLNHIKEGNSLGRQSKKYEVIK